MYTTSPGKTYCIEPHGGEIDYDKAKKNPRKFYDDVFNQDITEHEIGRAKAQQRPDGSPIRRTKTIEIKSKVTKRPYLKIMEKIESKLQNMFLENLGREFQDDIEFALKDK